MLAHVTVTQQKHSSAVLALGSYSDLPPSTQDRKLPGLEALDISSHHQESSSTHPRVCAPQLSCSLLFTLQHGLLFLFKFSAACHIHFYVLKFKANEVFA